MNQEYIATQNVLKCTFRTGYDEEGRPMEKSKSYRNLRLDATPEQLKQVSDALGTLSETPIVRTERVETALVV